ncbi:MAG: hypothetical protein F4X89_01585, partial [Dehalococcoidia bacterium]|nr:hypothetical protein [Dehalococcoidia bacterium]
LFPAVRPSLPETPVFDGPPGVYTDITVGAAHACALTEDGEAVCWDIERGTVWDTPSGTYTFIEAKGAGTCAITDEGAIVCWASGGGPIPEGEADPSKDAPPGRYATIGWDTAYFGSYFCALTVEGEAVCWVAGDDSPTPSEPPAGVFTSIGVWSSASFFPAGGWEHRRRIACATADRGEAVCWEASWNEVEPDRESQYVGQLPGSYRPASTWASDDCWLTAAGKSPCLGVGVDDPTRYEALAAGGGHLCAVTEGGEAVCRPPATDLVSWDPGTARVMTPPDPGPERFVALGIGAGNSRYEGEPVYGCALTETGRPVCWRDLPNKLERPDPDPNQYVAVSDGLNHTCALTPNAEALCWGWNDFGQAEAPAGRYVSISAGVNGSCALAETGEVVCWGRSVSGLFEAGAYKAVAVATDGWAWDGACVVTESGDALCRQKGDGMYIDDVEYVERQETPFVTLGVGGLCGLTEEGAAVCWIGWRSYRDGDSVAHRLPGSLVALSDGPGQACAISDSAELVCWWHFGNRWSPGLPDGPYMAVSTGYERGCALTDDGEARCWELGSGLVVPPPNRYVVISSGGYRTCAVTEAGEVVCWGNTNYERSYVPSK